MPARSERATRRSSTSKRQRKAEKPSDVDALGALKAELRDAEAYYTRHLRWVAEVKGMTAEQVVSAWQTAEEWQLRNLAIQALEVDPLLRLELQLYRETGGKGVGGEYKPPSATLAQVLAAMADKRPCRHPCTISGDIANVNNERLCN